MKCDSQSTLLTSINDAPIQDEILLTTYGDKDLLLQQSPEPRFLSDDFTRIEIKMFLIYNTGYIQMLLIRGSGIVNVFTI